MASKEDISGNHAITSQADNLDKLVEAGKKAAEDGQFDLAETSALQAMVGAKEAMNNFLRHKRNSPYREQQIKDWFETCAFILNTMLLTFLCELNEITSLAERLERWEICSLISCEILETVELFIQKHRLDSRNRSKKVFRDFLMRVARCELRLGNHEKVKQCCHRVLDEFSDSDDPEAFEIWGKSLTSIGDYPTAQKKMKLALECAKDKQDKTAVERLYQNLEEISEHLKKPVVTVEADPNWLVGTEAERHKKVASENETAPKDTPKKKHKHRRPKARERSVLSLDNITSSRSRRSRDEPDSLRNRREMVTSSGDIHSVQKVPASNAETSTALMRHNRRKHSHISGKNGLKLEYDPSEVTSIASSYTDLSDSSSESESSETSLSMSSYRSDVLSKLSQENLEEPQEDDISFYELSCRFHGDSGDKEDIGTQNDNTLLKEGLKLNATFLTKIKRENSRKNADHEFYDTLLATSDCEEKLKQQPKRFKRCSLQIDGSHKSYCKPLSSDNKISVIEISGRSKAGRTFNEDEVAVEILDDAHENKDRRYGKVVGILSRKRQRNVKHPVFVCTLDDMESYLVRPMCKTVPKINILHNEIYKRCYNQRKNKIELYKYDHRNGALELEDIKNINRADRDKYVFLVALLQWEEGQKGIYPLGAVIRILPCGDSLLHGLKILDLQHEVPSVYSAATVRRLESVLRTHTDEPPDNVTYNRLDLTEINTFTIDPPGSKDLDDALSIEKVKDCFCVGVHIADVSVYVEKGDAIDKEAFERAVSFYPGVKGPRHMLPDPLSQNICSLVPSKKRLCISVLHYLGSEGQYQKMEIKLSVIKSRQQFTYREVQEIIKSPNTEEGIPADIRQLYRLAEKRRKRRLGNAMFALDSDTDDYSEDSVEDTLEAHYLVEEFMVLTNRKIAKFVGTTFPNIVPQRCQPPPTRESLNSFMKDESTIFHLVMKLQDGKICPKPSLDVPLESKAEHAVMVQKWLWDLILQSPEEAARFIKMDDLHPWQYLAYQHWLSIQEHAFYKCSGSLQKQEHDGNHFSLGYAQYTHFTSPIRRYIDIIVHRLVHCILQKQNTAPYSTEDVESICLHVNFMFKKSRAYEKGCKILQKSNNLKSDPQMYLCFIDKVSDKGISLCAPELRLISKEHRELSFNLLDMGFKPEEVQDAETGEVRIKAKWRKRLYDLLGSTALPDSASRETLSLLQHPGVIIVRAWEWANILKCVLECRYKDCKKVACRAKALPPDKGLEDVNTESRDVTKLQPNTTFCLSFSRGQSVKIQMTAAISKGRLEPRPQLYSVSKSFKCCLQHTDNPVQHLTCYSRNSTLDQYQSVEQYLERWLPLVIMQAAVGCVSSENTCTVNNVPIKFKGRSGKFSLSLSFCENRNIVFGGIIDEVDKDSDVNKKSYDFLCIKYKILKETVSIRKKVCPLPKRFWVAHGEIIKVIRKKEVTAIQNFTGDGKITISFNLHPLAADPPMGEAEGNGFLSCDVEILVKSEVDRRTETYLKMLPEARETLAARLALNNKPFSDLDRDHSHIAHLMERDLYIPQGDNVKPLPRNNIRQQEAIDKALGSRFSLIQGPPGTGKTYTGIKLLCLFNKINRKWNKKGNDMKQVLFCGPTNKSVDLVARWMRQRLGELCPKIVRIYGKSIEAADFPIPGKSFLTKRSTHNSKADEKLREVSLHRLIRKKGNSFAETINAFDAKFRKTNYESAPDDVKKYLKIIRDASIDELKKYEVILCTTTVGANPKVLEGTSIFQVIIDESGMCTEPQCLVLIIATKAEQVVLIGDHKQLRPIIRCKEAAELGLETSLFEKYWSTSAQRVEKTMLDTQYRMNPQLCRFPSDIFYDGELQTESGLWKDGRMLDIWTNKDRTYYPHVLIHVEGKEEVLTVSTEDGNEQSKSNKKEIEQVVKVIRYLIQKENIPANQVNVISQYNAQCSEIRQQLKKENFANVKVNTVVSSQGGEWDYVIFSTVRSLPEYKIEAWPTKGWCKHNLGFITDQNQINVALTRARKGLIIIGNKNLLRCDEVWRKLIEHYEDKNCIKSPEDFPPRKKRQGRNGMAR